MKKKTKLIIMSLVVLALIGAVIGVAIHNKNVEANTPVEESSTVISDVLFDMNAAADLESVKVTCGSDSYTLIQNGTTSTGTLVWAMKEHMDWDLYYQHSRILGMGTKFNVYMTIEENVTDPSRLDEFGLKNPAAILTTTGKNGESHTVHIGNLSSDRAYAFCQLEGDNTVYACDAQYYTFATLTSGGMRQPSIKATIDTENGVLMHLRAQKAGDRPVEIDYDESIVANYVNGGATYIGTNLKFVEPYDNEALMVYTGLQAAYFKELPELEIAEVIDPNCDEKDFAQYGLSEEDPQYRETITFRTGNEGDYTYTTTDYIFGYTYYSGEFEYIYFREANTNLILGLDMKGMEGRQFTPFEFVNYLMFYEIITNVDSIDLTIDGQKYDLDILRQELDEEKGITEDNRLSAYYINGELVDDEVFTYLYRMLISVAPEYEIVGTEPVMDKKDVVTFTMHLTNGEDKVVTYYRTSEFYYVAQVGDDTWFATGVSYIDAIREALTAINAE